METHRLLLTILLFCLPVICLCKALGASGSDETQEQFGTPGFVSPHTSFQSWTDWLDKRSFGNSYPFGNQDFQAWKEWMDKRNLLHPGAGPAFGNGYGKSPAFQQWKDWMEKRGMSGQNHGSFKGLAPNSKAQFQAWSDWMVKRGLGGLGANGNGGGMFVQPSDGQFQSWSDFSKKANFGNDPDFSGMGKMQAWHLYQKRFGSKPTNPFAIPFNSKPNLMKWDEMFKRNEKRQLGSAPSGFGHYRQYFTNGLQDWRHTFQTKKRTSSNAKISKQENN